MTNMNKPGNNSAQKSKSMLQRELLRFADELDPVSFRAVTSGIGLGSMKKAQHAEPVRWHDPVVEMPPAAPAGHTRSRSDYHNAAGELSTNIAANTSIAARDQIRDQVREIEVPLGMRPTKIKRPSVIGGFSKACARVLAIFLVDTVVVALSLVVALAIAGSALGIRTDGAQAGFAGLSVLAPIKWLAGFSIVQVLAGFYGVFIVYALTLRIVAGGTLGQAIFRSSGTEAGAAGNGRETYQSTQNVTTPN